MRRFKRVLIESPYAGHVERNLKYARACCRYLMLSTAEDDRPLAPYASHLFYTQEGVLDDDIYQERDLGIEAGLAWGEAAEETIVCVDLGWSRGMQQGVEAAHACGRPVREFRLPPEELKRVLSFSSSEKDA